MILDCARHSDSHERVGWIDSSWTNRSRALRQPASPPLRRLRSPTPPPRLAGSSPRCGSSSCSGSRCGGKQPPSNGNLCPSNGSRRGLTLGENGSRRRAHYSVRASFLARIDVPGDTLTGKFTLEAADGRVVKYAPRYKLAFTLLNEDSATGSAVLSWDAHTLLAGERKGLQKRRFYL